MDTQTLTVLIGMSGSGKSMLTEAGLIDGEHSIVISPDEIRKDLGALNDMSRNNEVFALADQLLLENINQDNIIVDATNLNTHYRRKMVANCLEENPSLEVIYLLFPKIDVEVANQRIQDDLKNGIERANVPIEALRAQSEMYDKMLEDILHEDFVAIINAKHFLKELNLVKRDYVRFEEE